MIWVFCKTIFQFLIKFTLYLLYKPEMELLFTQENKKYINMHPHKSVYEYLQQLNVLLLKSGNSLNLNQLVNGQPYHAISTKQNSIYYQLQKCTVLFRMNPSCIMLCKSNSTQRVLNCRINISDFLEYADNRDKKQVSHEWLGGGV